MNTLKDGGVIIVTGIVVIAAVLGFFSQRIVGKDDSIPEEICEEIVEHYTGVEVDFSYDSPETEEDKTILGLEIEALPELAEMLLKG